MLKTCYCPSFLVCLDACEQEHSYLWVLTPTGFFSFRCPSFLRAFPSAKTVVNLFQPFPPSLPSSILSLSSSTLRPLSFLQLLPSSPTEVNVPDHGDHLLGLLESTILILWNLEIPDCDSSSFGNGQPWVSWAFRPGLERSVQRAYRTCLQGQGQAEAVGFWGLSISFPAVLPLSTCFSDLPSPPSTWEPHRYPFFPG